MKKKNLLQVLPMMGASIFAISASNAQSAGYTINGKLSNLDSKYVYLEHTNGQKMDSALVSNGSFTFKGNAEFPFQAIIALTEQPQRGKVFPVYIENSAIQVTGDAGALKDVKITGSKTQDDYEAYITSIKDISAQENGLYSKYQEAQQNKDTAAVAAIVKRADSLQNLATERLKQFITTHPKSAVSLEQVQNLAYSSDYAELNKLFSGLDESLKNSPNGKKIADHLAIMEKTADGKPAIAFTQNDVTGKAVSLSDFKGKYVLVDFWASWCGPCRAENPNVVKAYNKYKDKNFTILGVSLDQNGDKWKEAIAKDNLTWTEVSDLKFWKNEAAVAYGVQAIPANFLIDPNGIIIGHNLRGEALEKKLAEVLK
ncbi:hypothetical protein A9P82_07860 [Arachidicoccus ginsenosidimutans]|uniref:TlpA disulfide reductase family protein n=1 Tax=Arachidicoccus sp. BS20 TaxID=1850526 RepID=UPI0007F0AC37|nr:TlpA disulfide reductase family protein [Arachidicoccus sp. BS20]ANI89214.1 hypothetical protein A9P82_07860 [Arachidicoccus sp. BS20]